MQETLGEKARRNWLMISIGVAMVLGIIAGLVLGENAKAISFVGDIFFRLIQMSIIPFIMCQIIEAVGSLTKSQLSKSGVLAIVLFFVSSLLASAFGIFVALVLKPGVDFGGMALANADAYKATTMTTQEMLVSFVPKNIFGSMSDGSIIQVIVFSICLGASIIGYVAEHGKSKVLDLIHETNDLLMGIIKGVMNLAPIGVFAFVASTVGSLGVQAVVVLIRYMIIFGIADAIFMLVWLIVVSGFCRLNFAKLVKKMLPMSLVALATTSSAVTLPTEMDDAKNKIGLDEDIANLVLPLGMPLNSNGAAMYMAFTAIMIAQIYSITFDGPYLVFIAIVSVLLSLANAVVPGAGIVSLTMMVPQFGLPIESIAIFAGIDWVMGMFRTILNVNSDVFCALLVAKVENKIDYAVFNDEVAPAQEPPSA